MFDDVFPIDQRVKSLLLMAKSRYLLGYAPTMAMLIIKYGTPPQNLPFLHLYWYLQYFM
jgi:hypothetical protein